MSPISGFRAVNVLMHGELHCHVRRSKAVEDGGQRVGPLLSQEGREAFS